MADEFLTKFYLGLADVLSASVLTPRERKFIEIINKQNAVLEEIAAGVMDRSPQQIANLAKGATVIIVEKGAEQPVPMAEYAAKVTASADPRVKPGEAEPAEKPPKPVDKSVDERIKSFSALKLVDLPPPPEVATTVGGGMARAAGRRHDILPALILAATTLCSVAAVAFIA